MTGDTGSEQDVEKVGQDYDSVEPQCIALKADGERCTNGTTYSPTLCGTHKKVDDPDLAPDQDEREWGKCPHCGWQPLGWSGSGNPPHCGCCGVELPSDAPRWSEEQQRPMTDGGTEQSGDRIEQEMDRLPMIPWCGDCWDQAADGTKRDRDGELPDECERCGAVDEVFWI